MKWKRRMTVLVKCSVEGLSVAFGCLVDSQLLGLVNP